ncbi:hypothetical protein [Glaciimonas sp. PCH181]|uniref:hypothetical protein n=1 Tax=Glaciimonas sp. PCH181 TaxID=2133943 RepID=UPI000D33D963|nr:hypothetical protein [Glaciimonas sp. PCH181]PUA19291.1 hypothetical protein C7W93_05280 [Glaciimonas sp. PCH181]
MLKNCLRNAVITLTMTSALPVVMTTAHAQINGARATIKADTPVAAECQMLAERMKELDQFEQRRQMERDDRGVRDNRYQNRRPYKSQEWIRQQRSDTQTKMFFARC